MKKDELKRQVEGTFREFGNNYLTPYELRVRILELLDQLDEPEVLSWEWIEENSALGQFATSKVINFDKFVKADKLQNLLVPKQPFGNSEELPVIPKFVANYIEDMKKDEIELLTAFSLIEDLSWDETSDEYKTYVWLNKRPNDETFAKAWLNGFTAEEEQKYRIELPNSEHGVVYIAKDVVTGEPITRVDVHNGDYVTDLTEEEIKKLDSRFWLFAKPIEELEE